MEHSLPSNLICGQGCPWNFDSAAIISWVLGLQAYATNCGLWGVGDWAQSWCMRRECSTNGAVPQSATRSITYRSLIASLYAILLSVIRQGGCHTGVIRYFRGACQRVTVPGFMMSFGGEELCFLWPTSEKNFAFCDLLQGEMRVGVVRENCLLLIL